MNTLTKMGIGFIGVGIGMIALSVANSKNDDMEMFEDISPEPLLPQVHDDPPKIRRGIAIPIPMQAIPEIIRNIHDTNLHNTIDDDEKPRFHKMIPAETKYFRVQLPPRI